MYGPAEIPSSREGMCYTLKGAIWQEYFTRRITICFTSTGLRKNTGGSLQTIICGLAYRQAQWTVLAGQNGAGKSTAIKAMAGLLRFSGFVHDRRLPNKSMEAKRMAGYVPEPRRIWPIDGRRHMEFMARAYQLPDDWKERATYFLSGLKWMISARSLGKS
jgi:ABC-type multidrug transport system ATPase subunit